MRLAVRLYPRTMQADPETSEDWLRGLYELNAVVAESGEPVAGNIFYDHRQEDYETSPPIAMNRAKRDRFRLACAGRTRMLEIGVNAGHSAYLALTSDPQLEFHGVDIGDHSYVRPAVAWLEKAFPDRVFYYEGSCLDVLPKLAKDNMRFDLFHIDGAKHTYYLDVLNSHRLIAGDSALVIIDDANMGGVERMWQRCLREGLIVPDDDFRPMPDTEAHRNQIGMLRPIPRWKWTMSRTRELVRRSPLRRRLRFG